MKNNHFALGKKNLWWIGIGFVVIVVGFLFMLGAPSTEAAYNPDIFGFRRIVLAPTISFVGFVLIVVGILIKPTNRSNQETNEQ